MKLNKENMEQLRLVYLYDCDFGVGEWYEFLQSAGICFIEKENLYFITDEKKWMLAKIKYGI
jgi:hypothetical protein